MDTFYKVVKEIDGRFFSCTVEGDWEVEYKIDATTYPKPPSKLFVFSNLLAANLFVDMEADTNESWVIFPCEVKNPTKARLRSRLCNVVGLQNRWLKEFWDSEHYAVPCHSVKIIDEAVFLSDRVTIINPPIRSD